MHQMSRDTLEALERAKQASLQCSEDADRRQGQMAFEARHEAARAIAQTLPEWTQRLLRPQLVDGGPGGKPPPLPRKFRDQAVEWTRGSANLLLLGPTGSGKSQACAALLRRLLAVGVRNGGPDWTLVRTAVWAHSSALDRARREHPMGCGDALAIVAASSASLLVLEDLCWDRDPIAVRDVLKARNDAGLPTIANSGEREGRISQYYGGPIVRVLLDAGGRTGAVVSLFDEGSQS